MPRGRSNNPRAPSHAATAAREPASSSAAAATAADAARAARGRIAPQFSVLSATKDLSAALSVLKSTSSSVSSSSATTAAAHSSSSSALDDPEAACSGSNSMDMDEGQADGAAGAEATAFVDAAPLLALLEAHHDKNDALDLRELLELMSQFDVQALWREAASAVHNIASKRAYLVDEINANEDDEINMSLAESLMAEDALKEKRQRASAAAKAAHDALFGVSSLVLLAVQPRSRSDEDAAASRPPCEALFETLRTLHGLLFDLALCDGEAIAVIVARCCERWWVSEWSNREELVTQLLPYLLATAMADNAKQADVKRIHGVRHALELLDFDDPSAETIRGLLLRGMSAGAFLKKKPTRKSRSKSKNKKSKRKKQNKKMNKGKTRATAEEPEEDSVASDASDNDEIALKADASSEDDGEDGENIDRLFSSDGASMSSSLALSEGQRVLAFSFGLNASLAADMYAALKSHLPHATPAQHTSHGVVLFRAWKNSLTSGATKTRSVLEEQCVQDLMATAIKVASRTLFSACRRILQAFTSQKRRDGVDEMLFRLYNPIIWRGLSAAHPEVRRQAAVLFIDAFPLQDPAAPNVETDALLLKQFSELQRLLEDQVPSVRSVAIEGASRILAEYWELIPVRFAKKMLTTMVDRVRDEQSASAQLFSLKYFPALAHRHFSDAIYPLPPSLSLHFPPHLYKNMLSLGFDMILWRFGYSSRVTRRPRECVWLLLKGSTI